MSITLTEGQQAAYVAFQRFITNPAPGPFVIQGFSGTGKSTLVEHLLNSLNSVMKTAKLLDSERFVQRDVVMTATTNQAADTFAKITGQDVRTIHSALGLRVQKDYATGKSTLVPRSNADPIEDCIVFIDEASYMDKELLQLVFKRCINCKIVFIGDPAQLLNVGSRYAPVFQAGFPTAKLTEVVRQAKGNPIVDLSTAFRDMVNTGEFFAFSPDNQAIQHMDRSTFEDKIIAEFNDPNWHHAQSKVLAWTNKTVIAYNKAIRANIKGEPELKEGDFAVCNHFVQNGSQALKTDQIVRVTKICGPYTVFGVDGAHYSLDGRPEVFMPHNWNEAKVRLKAARQKQEWSIVRTIEDKWADLRAAFSCTINKSQGSTYDRVFVDLDDVKKCHNNNQLARMLYVAVSRARETVYLTGDLV
jgi:ATP-dependent exoDNAse (exonuclease V) alpha subunit